MATYFAYFCRLSSTFLTRSRFILHTHVFNSNVKLHSSNGKFSSCFSYFSESSSICNELSHCPNPNQTMRLSTRLHNPSTSSLSTRSSLRGFSPFMCSSSHHRRGQDRQKPRYDSFIVPPTLIAISFFTRKKDEVEEAREKLKDVDELELYIRQAKLAESRREWAEAAEFYHQALSLLNFRKQEKLWEEPRILETQVYIYDNMANLALSRGRLKESEKLYKETVKGLLAMGREKDDNGIVEISLKLAMIYAMQQREKESEAGYLFCLNTMEKKISNMKEIDDNFLALYGMCINSYSRFLIIHDRLPEAESALKETIDIAVRALSKEHVQVAVLYSDLATVSTMQGNHRIAKEHIRQAIDIGEKTNSPDLATYLCNKGLICMELEEFAQAEKCCNRALKMAQNAKDKDTEHEARLCLQDIKERKKKS